MEPIRFTVRDGHPASPNGWVYAWTAASGVIYVGATWMHPAARAELHLNGDMDDARSLALRGLVSSEVTLEIVAVAVPANGDRAAHKSALIFVLSSQGLLSDDFVGDVAATAPTEALLRWAERAAAACSAH